MSSFEVLSTPNVGQDNKIVEISAVSYTHLDVYKRQHKEGPGPNKGMSIGRENTSWVQMGREYFVVRVEWFEMSSSSKLEVENGWWMFW